MAIHTAFTSGSGSMPVFYTKKDTDIWIPVLLLDATDGVTGETGIAFGAIDCDYSITSTASLTAYTVTTNDWVEQGEGMYSMRIGASEFTAAGRYIIRIGDTVPAAGVFVCAVEVSANDIDDVATDNLNINDIRVVSAKKDTDIWAPVLLIDKDDGFTPITGVAFGSVDADYSITSTAGLTSYTVTTNDWVEQGEGMYALRIGASEFTAVGTYFVRVVDTTPNAGKYFIAVEVTAATIDDLPGGSLPSMPSFSAKISTDTWVPVRLLDITDGVTGITGIAFGSVDADYALASATSWTSYTPTTDDWKEIGEGNYAIRIGAAEFATVGRYVLRVVDVATSTALKFVCAVETTTVTSDDLVRSTTPANTLDIDASGLVDVSKFNGTAVTVNGTTNLLSVDVGAVSSDATAADTLETIIEGSALLSVDVTKISGDSTAADDLELFIETMTSGVLQTGSFAANCITEALLADDTITSGQLAATATGEIADAVWDEAQSAHVSVGSFGLIASEIAAILADTGTDGVQIDLTQVMAETHSDLTVGYSLYVMYAHFVHKWTTSGGISTVHKSAAAGAGTFQTRTISSTDTILEKS